ncbi:MAG: AsmA-like C-terminal region-containing protein [Geminicoccaceae bacterium]
MEQLEIAKLIVELGGQPMVQAPLGATFDLSATGADIDALGKSLDGSVAVTVGSGTVGTRLIDLTGENIVSWLFTSGSSASLACADGKITFSSGLGTVQQLILETDNVQLRGSGTIDFNRDRLDLSFQPRPLREQLLQVVTPFRVRGSIDAPEIRVAGGTSRLAGRAVAETLTLPLNVLRALLDRGGSNRVPCAADP